MKGRKEAETIKAQINDLRAAVDAFTTRLDVFRKTLGAQPTAFETRGDWCWKRASDLNSEYKGLLRMIDMLPPVKEFKDPELTVAVNLLKQDLIDRKGPDALGKYANQNEDFLNKVLEQTKAYKKEAIVAGQKTSMWQTAKPRSTSEPTIQPPKADPGSRRHSH